MKLILSHGQRKVPDWKSTLSRGILIENENVTPSFNQSTYCPWTLWTFAAYS